MSQVTVPAETPTLDLLEELDAELSLDALLAESMEAVGKDKKAKQARDRLKRKDLGAEEREDLEALVREWEARKEWKTLAHVAVFHHQQCTCGAVHKHFSHMMYHQQHRTDKHAQRWIRATAFADTTTQQELEGLPNKVAFQHTVVPVCEDCAAEAGFDLSHADVSWEVVQMAVAVETQRVAG